MKFATKYLGMKDAIGRWVVKPALLGASPQEAPGLSREWKDTCRRKPTLWVTPRPAEELREIDRQGHHWVTLEPLVTALLDKGSCEYVVTTKVDGTIGRVIPKDVVAVEMGSATAVDFDLGCLLLQPKRLGQVFVEVDQPEVSRPIPMDPNSPKKAKK